MTAPDRAWLEAHAHLSNRDAAAAWGCSEITIRRMYQRAGIAHGIQKYKRYNDCGSCKARPLCRLIERSVDALEAMPPAVLEQVLAQGSPRRRTLLTRMRRNPMSLSAVA